MIRTYAEFVIRKRIAIISIIGVITLFLAYHSLSLKMVIERDNQLPQNHPLIKLDNRIMETFGGASVAVLCVRPRTGDIFNNKTLGEIKHITDEVMKLKGVKKNNVLCLASTRVKDIQGKGSTVDISPLLRDLPLSADQLKVLKRRIYLNEIVPHFLVSKDERTAAIVFDFDSTIPFSNAYRGIEKIVRGIKNSDYDIFLGGSVVDMYFIQAYSSKMAFLFVFAMVIIGLIHFEAFRTVQAIILPLVTALISVVWALGFLGYFNIRMDAWNSLTPILILAVAAGHAVQILKRYYEEYDNTGDNNRAVIEAVSNAGPAMLVAGCTAAAGFLSLLIFGIASVRVFGLFTALGILSALILEMTFIPAVRSMISPPSKRNTKKDKKGYLDHLAEWISGKVLNRPKLILCISVIVLLVSITGAFRLKVNNSFIDTFPKDDKVRVDERFINKNFSGTSTMNILVEGKEPDALKSPAVLNAMDALQQDLEKRPHVGKVISLTVAIKQINRAMHGGDQAFYRIPESRNLIAQYLLLYSDDDLRTVVDEEYKTAVIRVFTTNDTAAYSTRLLAETKDIAAKYFRDTNVTLGIAGGTLGNQNALNETVIKEKIQNIWQIILIIFLISAYSLRSLIGGLYVITPSILSIIINFGFMGITGIWLSLSTAAVSALTISIGADYAIYFIYRYREEFRKYHDHHVALRETMLTSGKAIYFVSSAIASGFAILLFSGLIYHKQLGGLVALSMVTSSFGTVTLLPAMITLFKPNFVRAEITPALCDSNVTAPETAKEKESPYA